MSSGSQQMSLGNKPYRLAAIAGLVLFALTILVFWLASTTPKDAPSPDQMPAVAVRPSTGTPRSKTGNSTPAPRPAMGSFVSRLSNGGEGIRLSREQIDAFVGSRGRNVDSLLSAFRLSGDEAFLREALERFPNDPQTLTTALRFESDPGKRLKMAEAIKRADPGNAMGCGMAAVALLDMGRKDEAFAELQALSGKPFDELTLISSQNDEEAYLASGVSAAEAKMTALYSQSSPHILQLRKLSTEMAEMRAAYRSSGDPESAETLLQIQLGLGRQLQSGISTVESLVGMAMEKQGLKDIDSDDARSRLEEIDLQNEMMREQSRVVSELMKNPSVPESDWLLYFDRLKLFGESAANTWMTDRYPAP